VNQKLLNSIWKFVKRFICKKVRSEPGIFWFLLMSLSFISHHSMSESNEWNDKIFFNWQSSTAGRTELCENMQLCTGFWTRTWPDGCSSAYWSLDANKEVWIRDFSFD
jgi:hypothetical protein